MAREISLSVEIAADADTIWAILTDFPAIPSWNPFIREISGSLREGSTLSVHIAPPGKAGMRFKPVVLVVRPGQELRWKGKLLVPGLFDGEHWFRSEPLDAGRTRFTQGEIFSGMLVPLAGAALLRSTRAGFAQMNEALKRRAESAARSSAG